jgi:hypothetical protein
MHSTYIDLMDLDTVVADLIHNGRTWSGTLPPECTDASLRQRLEGAAFSFLVLVDGTAGPGPTRLAPRDDTTTDLGGRALYEVFGSGELGECDAQERRLFDGLLQLVDEHAGQPGPVEVVIGRFLTAVCQLVADGYELRLVDADPETGEPLAVRSDVAGELPAAFATAWAEVHA